MELPPHTRRRACRTSGHLATLGTTSAYAEKRIGNRLTIRWGRNYLRIRGEESHAFPGEGGRWELPPHTRRRVVRKCWKILKYGTTSAYAEKSGEVIIKDNLARNYLRIRGEEKRRRCVRYQRWELPPHTRRRVCSWCRTASRLGTTSAYAEKRG